jgi:hypothetical protein
VPRISREYLARIRRQMGESWYRQEFYCSFEALEGLVYPDFARCVMPGPAPVGTKVGGLDFGLRNPFAAVWGVLDRDGVFWLTGEHYARDQTLAYHAKHLPRDVMWYADPEGAREIKELLVAGFKVRRADNQVTPGLAAVRARVETGTLKVVQGCCPNLLAEAALYRYDPDSKSEKPIKEYDHALDALRYVVSRIDWKQMARIRKQDPPDEPPPVPVPKPPPAPNAGGSPAAAPPPAPQKQRWLSIHNEQLWTRIE